MSINRGHRNSQASGDTAPPNFNKLVQDQAAAGHAAIQAYSERFTVVGNVATGV